MTSNTTTTIAKPATYDDVVRGVLLETSTNDEGQACIVLAIPNTNYRLHLLVDGAQLETPKGQAVPGRIKVQANRVDSCKTGGQFIDPVMGRPRTIQGRVRTIDPENNQLVIQAKIAICAQLREPQNAGDFSPGDLVRFVADRGATFAPHQ